MPRPTDPGQSHLYDVIKGSFDSFGYQATDAEIASLMGTAEGQTGGEQRGLEAVGNYVSTVRQQQNLEANNPLKQVLSDEKGFYNDTQAKMADLYGKVTGAPQLFGGMTPDQIDQYLAPVKRAHDQAISGVESTFARRGLPGSSLEANALAEQSKLYGEDVLKTGLDVGLQHQGNLLSLYNNLTGVSGSSLGRQANDAAGIESTAEGNLATKTQLPLFLNSYSMGKRAFDANEQAQIAAQQAAREAAHKSGFSWNVGLGPLKIGQDAKGATNAGFQLSTKDLATLSGYPNAGLLEGTNPTSGAKTGTN